MNTILEKEKKTPIAGEYDVIVAGGGVAGIAAALASARHGVKTLLLERMFLLGGLATAGLVTVYLPLCDGEGHQVSFGLAEELLRLSIRYGYEAGGTTQPERDGGAWLLRNDLEERKKTRFEVQFNANLFAILAEQLLTETGVTIVYGTSVVGVETEDNRIHALITESKSGRQAFLAKTFIDASGDADLAFLAGEKTVEFGQGNVLASWFYEFQAPYYQLYMLGGADRPDKYKKPDDPSRQRKRYRGLEADEITQFVLDSHANLKNRFLNNGEISKDHALATIATIPQLRMTRRIDGQYTLDDTEDKAFFEDSIGMICDWRKRGPVYEVPYRTLVCKTIKNLITCGRIISVTDAMWDISRVIPPCVVTGEAAGTAAALISASSHEIDEGPDFHSLSVERLQSELKENGVKLHCFEVL